MTKKSIPSPKAISVLEHLFDHYKALYIPYPFYCIDPIVNIGRRYKNTKRIVYILKDDAQPSITKESLFQDLIIEIMVESLRDSLRRQLLMEVTGRSILKPIKPISYSDFDSLDKLIYGGFRI